MTNKYEPKEEPQQSLDNPKQFNYAEGLKDGRESIFEAFEQCLQKIAPQYSKDTFMLPIWDYFVCFKDSFFTLAREITERLETTAATHPKTDFKVGDVVYFKLRSFIGKGEILDIEEFVTIKNLISYGSYYVDFENIFRTAEEAFNFKE